MDAASAELAKHGILGVLLFFAGVAIWLLWSSAKTAAENHALALATLNASHAATLKSLGDAHAAALKLAADQRASDQQSMQTQLLRMITDDTECLTTVANGMEAEQRAMGELRKAFDELRKAFDDGPGFEPRPRRK